MAISHALSGYDTSYDIVHIKSVHRHEAQLDRVVPSLVWKSTIHHSKHPAQMNFSRSILLLLKNRTNVTHCGVIHRAKRSFSAQHILYGRVYFCPLFRIPQTGKSPVFWVRQFSDWVRPSFWDELDHFSAHFGSKMSPFWRKIWVRQNLTWVRPEFFS